MIKVSTPAAPLSSGRVLLVRLAMGEGSVGLVRSTIWMASLSKELTMA